MRVISIGAVVLLLLLPCALFAAVPAAVGQADALHDQGKYLEARDLLVQAVSGSGGAEAAELYWRIARETLELGDIAEKAKKPTAEVLKVFEEGRDYGDKAIAADPRNYLGYYWKSANMGRWGQVKGVLNALFMAQPIKELLLKDLSLNAEHSDAFYVLGQFYRELPGWPVSFGNLDFAVSLGRLSVDLRTDQVKKGIEKDYSYAFSTELGKTLYKRNWQAAARLKEQKAKRARYEASKDVLERGSNYEGVVTLQNVSDRDEAKALVAWVVDTLQVKPGRTAGDEKDLQKAKEVLKTW